MKGLVYFLISERKENWIYVGSTINLRKRLAEHHRVKVPATKGFRPLKLIYKEEYPDIDSARKREYFLKGWEGRRVKKEILKVIGVACLRRQV